MLCYSINITKITHVSSPVITFKIKITKCVGHSITYPNSIMNLHFTWFFRSVPVIAHIPLNRGEHPRLYCHLHRSRTQENRQPVPRQPRHCWPVRGRSGHDVRRRQRPFGLLGVWTAVLRHVGGIWRYVFDCQHPEPLRHIPRSVHPHQRPTKVIFAE